MIRRLLVGLASLAAAGSPLSAGALGVFLGTAGADTELAHRRKQVALLSSATGNFPWLRGIEVRTSTDEFDFARQRWGLRLLPRGWGETGADSRLRVAELDLAREKVAEALFLALQERYRLLVDYLYYKARSIQEEKLFEILQQKVQVIKQSLGTLNLDVNDLINAEGNRQEQELAVHDLRGKVAVAEARVRLLTGGGAFPDFATDRPVPVDLMVANVGAVAVWPLSELHSVRLAEREARVALHRFELERAKERVYPDFIEFSWRGDRWVDNAYTVDRSLAFSRTFSVELNFKLPWITDARRGITARELDSREREFRWRDAREKADFGRRNNVANFQRYASQYRVLGEGDSQAAMRAAIERYVTMEGAHPLSLVKIRETGLRREIYREIVLRNLRLQYLDILEVAGAYVREPYVNWLSAAQEPLVL